MASANGAMNLQFVDETGNVAEDEGFDRGLLGRKRRAGWDGAADDDSDSDDGVVEAEKPRPGKKTRGRVKIRMAYITDKVRRYTTFSKRKTGIMKKAYELAVLTGTQVMLLVASETGHVYTFATRKLQPVIMSENGKALIQTCLNSPDAPSSPPAKDASAASKSSDERTSPLGFEEPSLTCAVHNEKSNQVSVKQQIFKSDVLEKQENPVRLTGITAPATATLDQSGVTISATSASLPVKLLREQVSVVNPYLAAMKEANHSTSTSDTLSAMVPQTAPKTEAAPTQFYYRIEGSNQFLPIPVESCAKVTSVGEDVKLKPANCTLTTQPVAVVNGGTASGGMLMYPSQGTVVLPVQSAAANLLSEGYLLNITNAAPTLAVASDTTVGSTQQLLTLPFPVSGSQISQPDSLTSGLVNPLLRFVDSQTKPTQRK